MRCAPATLTMAGLTVLLSPGALAASTGDDHGSGLALLLAGAVLAAALLVVMRVGHENRSRSRHLARTSARSPVDLGIVGRLLDETRGGDAGLLIRSFIEDAELRVERAMLLASQSDLPKLAEEARALATLGATFGAAQIVDVAAALERACLAGATAEVELLAAQLGDAADVTLPVYRDMAGSSFRPMPRSRSATG